MLMYEYTLYVCINCDIYTYIYTYIWWNIKGVQNLHLYTGIIMDVDMYDYTLHVCLYSDFCIF
jgi:hypothetical protein